MITFCLLLGLTLVSGCVKKEPEQTECVLSLCDCKCYPKGQTPEELTGRICGINCLGEYGITGCEYKDGECEVVYECQSDEDCVPAQCCHPTSCISKDRAPDCSGIACTEECRGGTMDCGCGHCECVDGKCQVVWTKNEDWC